MNLELWGNDGQRDFKICEVDNRQFGAIIEDALVLAQRSGHPGFKLIHIWLRDMSNPRKPVMLGNRPVDPVVLQGLTDDERESEVYYGRE